MSFFFLFIYLKKAIKLYKKIHIYIFFLNQFKQYFMKDVLFYDHESYDYMYIFMFYICISLCRNFFFIKNKQKNGLAFKSNWKACFFSTKVKGRNLLYTIYLSVELVIYSIRMFLYEYIPIKRGYKIKFYKKKRF